MTERTSCTATGMVFGTPWYMSPEQAIGSSAIDARTDLWSVGAMLYEMLCGTLPFGATSPNAVMAQIIYGEPMALSERLPGVAADLNEVVHRALQRDLGKRFATMVEFRAALVGCELWRGVTPAMAESFFPRPGSLEGIDELLSEEFRQADAELQVPLRSPPNRSPSTPRPSSQVGLSSPRRPRPFVPRRSPSTTNGSRRGLHARRQTPRRTPSRPERTDFGAMPGACEQTSAPPGSCPSSPPS